MQGKQNSDYLHGLSMIGVQQIDRVVEVVEETLKVNARLKPYLRVAPNLVVVRYRIKGMIHEH